MTDVVRQRGFIASRIAGLERDTHLKGKEFNTALASTFTCHLVFQRPLL